MVAANLGPLALVYEGSISIQAKNSSILGMLKVYHGNTATTTDSILLAAPSDNPPLTILSRPNNNLLEVWVWKNTAFTSAAMPTNYILTLSFEEIDN